MKKLLLFSTLFLLFVLACQADVGKNNKKNESRTYNTTKKCMSFYKDKDGVLRCKKRAHLGKPKKPFFLEKNETNCSQGKILKCKKYHKTNKTFCRCKNPKNNKNIAKRDQRTKCPKGTIHRCRTKKGQYKCFCKPVVPIYGKNKTKLNCPEGTVAFCKKDKKKRRSCFCRKLTQKDFEMTSL